jgi:transcriptional regulator with XRE-family HTH domain
VISLAQRVRDFRYSKGWGPDELASRAEISRTALYQIESGKTGLPRAGTLRRIAVALDVSMDELLGHVEVPRHGYSHSRASAEYATSTGRARDLAEWIPSEGGPLALPSHPSFPGHSPLGSREETRSDEARSAGEPATPRFRASAAPEMLVTREGELISKFREVLHSPLGPGIARIVDELHLMLPRARHLS